MAHKYATISTLKGIIMKAIVLCAGYATRLGKLTENTPKPLLKVQNKTLLDLLMENLEKIDDINEIVIVSNAKFYNNFLDWSKKAKSSKKITVLNDGSTNNENRLGAIGDIKFAITKRNIDDDIMVLAGDNWFDFKLKTFYDKYKSNGNSNMILGAKTNDMSILRSHGVAILDDNHRVISMEEKPQNPKGNFAVGPFYIYNKNSVKLIDEYLKSGNSKDAPGNLPSWLCEQTDVFAWDISPAHRIDIGTVEVYENIDNIIRSLKFFDRTR